MHVKKGSVSLNQKPIVKGGNQFSARKKITLKMAQITLKWPINSPKWPGVARTTRGVALFVAYDDDSYSLYHTLSHTLSHSLTHPRALSH